MRIILLRHGQYKKNPLELLTALGRRQARRSGRRMREYEISEMRSSTMPRARETAKIVRKTLGIRRPTREDELLCECIPGFPLKGREAVGIKGIKGENRLRRDKRQAEAAFQKYFRRRKSRGTLLLVCHGNIIRYLVCRSIGADPLLWVNLDVQQCGITIVEWSKRTDCLNLITHNDVGHIPIKERTFI